MNTQYQTYIARKRNFRGSPQKLRLTADLIRGLSIEKAHDVLDFAVNKPSQILSKLLSSAIANAEEKSADVDNLAIASIKVDKAMVLKRFKASGRGRIRGINHRFSHIELILEDRSHKIDDTPEKKKEVKKEESKVTEETVAKVEESSNNEANKETTAKEESK